MTWQTEYQQAVALVLLTEGSFGEKDYYGGFRDGEKFMQHRNPKPTDRDQGNGKRLNSWEVYNERAYGRAPAWCDGWTQVTDVQEEMLSDFKGTFYDGPQQDLFVTGKATCRCGFISKEQVAWQGSISSMIGKVVGSLAKVTF